MGHQHTDELAVLLASDINRHTKDAISAILAEAEGLVSGLEADLQKSVENAIVASCADVVNRYGLVTDSDAPALRQRMRLDAFFQKLEGASIDRVRGLALELRQAHRLHAELAFEALDRSALLFFEVTVAVLSGRSVAAVREALSARDIPLTLEIFDEAGFSKSAIRQIAGKLSQHY